MSHIKIFNDTFEIITNFYLPKMPKNVANRPKNASDCVKMFQILLKCCKISGNVANPVTMLQIVQIC